MREWAWTQQSGFSVKSCPPTVITLKVASAATCWALLIGAILSWALSGRRGFWVALVEAVILFPLVLPPTILGFYLLLLLGKSSLLGKILWDATGLEIVFTPLAAVVAASTAALPIAYKACKSFFDIVDSTVIDAARIDGASEPQILFSVRLPLAAKGILTGLLLSFLRAMGEFGATSMIAGNIPGRTQTLSLAVWTSVMTGDIQKAHGLAAVLVTLCLTMIITIRMVDRFLSIPSSIHA